MLQPHTGRISLQRTPPFFLPSLRPLEAIYLTMARRHHILLFRRLAVARTSRARTGIVKRRRVTIASWLRGRRFELAFSTFVVKSCIVLARYFLRVGSRAAFTGVWRHFHRGPNFWILTLFGSGYAGLGVRP